MTRAEAGYWLAAAIDGEGHVRRVGNELSIANTSLDFMAMAGECLDVLGVAWSLGCARHRPGTRKDCYTLRVCGVDDLSVLSRWCPLSIAEKRDRLKVATVDKRFGKCSQGCTCGKHVYYPPKPIAV